MSPDQPFFFLQIKHNGYDVVTMYVLKTGFMNKWEKVTIIDNLYIMKKNKIL